MGREAGKNQTLWIAALVARMEVGFQTVVSNFQVVIESLNQYQIIRENSTSAQ